MISFLMHINKSQIFMPQFWSSLTIWSPRRQLFDLLTFFEIYVGFDEYFCTLWLVHVGLFLLLWPCTRVLISGVLQFLSIFKTKPKKQKLQHYTNVPIVFASVDDSFNSQQWLNLAFENYWEIGHWFGCGIIYGWLTVDSRIYFQEFLRLLFIRLVWLGLGLRVHGCEVFN